MKSVEEQGTGVNLLAIHLYGTSWVGGRAVRCGGQRFCCGEQGRIGTLQWRSTVTWVDPMGRPGQSREWLNPQREEFVAGQSHTAFPNNLSCGRGSWCKPTVAPICFAHSPLASAMLVDAVNAAGLASPNRKSKCQRVRSLLPQSLLRPRCR